MATHELRPTRENLHGRFSNARPPILRMASGDRIVASVPDAGWHLIEQPDLTLAPLKMESPGDGHALLGPIFVEDAEPGDALEIRFETIQPAAWGWTVAGGWPNECNERLGVVDTRYGIHWRIEGERAIGPTGLTLSLKPFLGWVGLALAEDGLHSTTPPRRVGGNLDCKELVTGSRLFLPVEVAGGLLSFGDGHAVQGDGEVSGVALECPMSRVELTIVRHPGAAREPWGESEAGLFTLGFGEKLDDAMYDALAALVLRLQAELDLSRNAALALASLKADLRITQIVNQVKGVHALLPRDAMRELGIAT